MTLVHLACPPPSSSSSSAELPKPTSPAKSSSNRAVDPPKGRSPIDQTTGDRIIEKDGAETRETKKRQSHRDDQKIKKRPTT